jgi:large subunit ribosomal protein L9e
VKEWGILTVAIGKLTKNLNHLAVNFSHPKKDVINIELHHGARKNVATLRTVRTLINNLIIGVTKGFKYKMRYVYAHFPINVNVDKNNETGLYEVEIRYVTSISSKDCRSGFG